MNNILGIAVDHVLAFGNVELDDAEVDPYITTMVFANAASRSAVPSLESQDDCDQFFNSWSSQLGKLGWTVRTADRIQTQTFSTSRGETTKLADKLLSLTVIGSSSSKDDKMSASPDNIATGFASMELLADETKEANVDSNADSLLSFWWEKTKKSKNDGKFACLTIGSISQEESGEESQLSCNLSVQFLDFAKITLPKSGKLGFGRAHKFDATTWQSLFVEVNDDLELPPIKSLTLELVPAVYAEKQAGLRQKLGDKAAEHYKTAKLPMARS